MCKEPTIIFEGSFKDAFALVSNEWPNIIEKMAIKNSKLAASGNRSNLAASGWNSKLAASGQRSNLAASGDWSNLAASGDNSHLAASGKNSICMIAGNNGQVKVGENGFFVLTYNNGTRNIPVVGIVGENGINANTWYKLDDTGKIVLVN